ncbi:DUF309 domain-containing protein [Rhodobacterales bacterium HKCCE2091]|nr:DUF309 domain-containing protein [Rhodobacterales bacterium HKCCE2091]
MTPGGDQDWRPGHAYVPGRTDRHPEGLFDRFKQGLDGIDPDGLHRTDAWRVGCRFLSEGYYWEAHEVLEALWMACPPNAPERLMVQAVIQRANAGLKAGMGRDRAAFRLTVAAEALAEEAFRRRGGAVMGLTLEDWAAGAGGGIESA